MNALITPIPRGLSVTFFQTESDLVKSKTAIVSDFSYVLRDLHPDIVKLPASEIMHIIRTVMNRR